MEPLAALQKGIRTCESSLQRCVGLLSLQLWKTGFSSDQLFNAGSLLRDLRHLGVVGKKKLAIRI